MPNYDSGPIGDHDVVSHDAWVAARLTLLRREKELSKARDEIARLRRALPWEKVEKPYAFDGPRGRETLADLFEGRRQLVVYHFMFDPSWKEGCAHCSFWADSFNALGAHLNHRDTTFVAISRAPLSKIDAFKQRMGWSFKWVSSAPSDFNFDFGVSFTLDEQARGAGVYNYVPGESRERARGRERLLQGREWRRLPHLLDLCARDRPAERHLQLPRPHAEGTGRSAAVGPAGVGPTPRSIQLLRGPRPHAARSAARFYDRLRHELRVSRRAVDHRG